MSCCLKATNHYLNQCWLIIGEVPWHSSQDDMKIPINKTRFKIAVLKWHPGFPGANVLTTKQLETHGCIISTVATDVLVLKQQATSPHSSVGTGMWVDFKIVWCMYQLYKDLGWNWISKSNSIKYVHNGRSYDLCMFGIPEISFWGRALKVGMLRTLNSLRLLQIMAWHRSLVQIMACRLTGAKPLSEPMLEYCQSDP